MKCFLSGEVGNTFIGVLSRSLGTRMLFIDSEEKQTCYLTSYRGRGGNGWVSDCLNVVSRICQGMTACPRQVLTWESRYRAA